LSYYLAQGVSKQDVQVLIQVLDFNEDGMISRSEWRESLAAFREGTHRKACAANVEKLSSMLLDALMAPVQPPKKESFKDLLPFGKYRGKPAHIDGAQHRAIKLDQLRVVMAHIERRCDKEQWTSSATIESTIKLSIGTVTHYDCSAYVVKPATAFHCCSLVELMSADGKRQRPLWYVSHWWGEYVLDFVRCVKKHAADRKLDAADATYWVAAFAVNQWELTDLLKDLPHDIANSAFGLAAKASKGMLCVVDAGANYFQRVWTTYEVCLGLEISERALKKDDDEQITTQLARTDNFFQLDVYTSDAASRQVHSLTDGVVAVDAESEAARASRQKPFPYAICRGLATTRMEDGRSTLPSDRTRILNSVVGASDLDAEPPANHDHFWQMNRLLWSRVFPRVLDIAVTRSEEEKDKFFKVLTLSGIERFAHSFVHDGVAVSNQYMSEPRGLAALLSALPDTIAHLHLALSASQFPDSLPSYKHLLRVRVLNLAGSVYLEELPEWLAELGAAHGQLKHLLLRGCVRLRKLPARLPEIYSKFKDIILDLQGCAALFHVDLPQSGDDNTPFRDIEQLGIVRKILKLSEEAHASDLLRVYDGLGRRFSDPSGCGVGPH